MKLQERIKRAKMGCKFFSDFIASSSDGALFMLEITTLCVPTAILWKMSNMTNLLNEEDEIGLFGMYAF